MAGFLLFWSEDSSSNTFDYSARGLTLRANAKALFNPVQAPVVRVRAPYLEEPAYGGFFAFWGFGRSLVALIAEVTTLLLPSSQSISL
jgi:hypothetical protein